MASEQVFTDCERGSDTVSLALYLCSVGQSNIPGSLANDGSGEDWDRFRERREPSAFLFFPYVRIGGAILTATKKMRRTRKRVCKQVNRRQKCIKDKTKEQMSDETNDKCQMSELELVS